MDERTAAPSRVHWTALLSLVVSVGLGAAYPCAAFGGRSVPLVAALVERLAVPLFPLLVTVSLPVFGLWCTLAVTALVIASRPPWQAGRLLALVAALLPGVILLLYGAAVVYFLFFWHPHLHFVG
jgi:hypothetical protein